MATVIFIHGLNTFGTDDLRIGAMKFGPMHARLERAFRKRDIDFVGVTGAGCGSPDEQADRAIRFLKETGYLEAVTGADSVFDLLGHSVGGLVARAMAVRPELQGRVRSILTMGTPHRGAHVAELGLDVDKRHPVLCKLLKAGGYDTQKKAAIFANFTPQAVTAFNARITMPKTVREISLLCEASRQELSWPYYFAYGRLHSRAADGTFPKSDGFILSESQKHGEVLGPFAVDHYGQLGYFFQLNPLARAQALREFERLVDTVAQLVAN